MIASCRRTASFPWGFFSRRRKPAACGDGFTNDGVKKSRTPTQQKNHPKPNENVVKQEEIVEPNDENVEVDVSNDADDAITNAENETIENDDKIKSVDVDSNENNSEDVDNVNKTVLIARTSSSNKYLTRSQLQQQRN